MQRHARTLGAWATVWALFGPFSQNAEARQDNRVAAAANAYSKAQAAELGAEHQRAAELYEMANNLAPSPEALRGAVRSRLQAKQLDKAAYDAELLMRSYPSDDASQKLASKVLGKAKTRLGRLTVTCDTDCMVVIDGLAVDADLKTKHFVYLNPGLRRITIQFGTGASLNKDLEISAGDDEPLNVEAPDVVTQNLQASHQPQPTQGGLAQQAPPPAKKPIPSWATLVGAGLTVALAGTATWSGLDTMKQKDRFESNPTQARFDKGESKQRRTNFLWIGTAVTGITTGVLALLTDW